MKFVVSYLTRLYSKLIHLYPVRFRDEFAEEMQIAFQDSLNDAIKDGIRPAAILCLREYGGLPFSVIREFWYELERKETNMATNENTESVIRVEMNRWVLKIFGVALTFVAFAWFYTDAHLASAQAKGIYSSPEQGMQALTDKMYSTDRNMKILNAGPYFFNGRQPHVWYVIAEVHATSHADGSNLKSHGCESPGLAFIQTKEGWVHVPDLAFPGFIGFWMEVFDIAGEGNSTPSTDSLPDQPSRFCNSDEMIWHGR